ncbi:MAG: LytTR family DNA-binding domain-containing protein [Bacteroidales bacterium]
MLRTIVIDDELPAREVVCNYLKEYCRDVEVVATAATVKGGYRAIRKYHPDFIFLDIEMADGKGFDLLTMFGKIDFKIVFITAYSEYAVRAFRCSAVDYLLKPVKIDELITSVERVRAMQEIGQGNQLVYELLRNLRSESALPQTLVIPNVKGFEVLRIPDIIMCQADGYCTNFYLTGGKKCTSSKNLKHFNELLADNNFIRIHHSYIINIDHVASYTRQGEIILTEGIRASLSDTYKASFINRLGRR